MKKAVCIVLMGLLLGACSASHNAGKPESGQTEKPPVKPCTPSPIGNNSMSCTSY
ncbi:MAG TPA: hypothetical protein PLF22_11610 [Pseudomonadales bacterium]|nr:hypothetical protein [Pseudomonadales bacterium]